MLQSDLNISSEVVRAIVYCIEHRVGEVSDQSLHINDSLRQDIMALFRKYASFNDEKYATFSGENRFLPKDSH
jgi:hypothetical protein